MQTNWRASIAALLLMPLVGTVTLMGTASNSDQSQIEILQVLRVSGWDNTADWHTYQNNEYGFQIKYPPHFDLAEDANALVASGAVVTFIPAYDASIDGTGAKTNLIAFSVTVGVTDCLLAPSQGGVVCLTHVSEHELNESRDMGHTRFAKSYSSEGAAGNRYEMFSYFTDCEDSRYEIALFVHSGNPGCYAPDAITIFNPAEIACLFEMMVATFLPAERCYVSL